MTFKEWLKSLTPDPDYKKGTGADIADTIALMVVMGLIMFIVLVT